MTEVRDRRAQRNTETAALRSRIGGLARSRDQHDPELADARRDLCAHNLAGHIARMAAAAPP